MSHTHQWLKLESHQFKGSTCLLPVGDGGGRGQEAGLKIQLTPERDQSADRERGDQKVIYNHGDNCENLAKLDVKRLTRPDANTKTIEFTDSQL